MVLLCFKAEHFASMVAIHHAVKNNYIQRYCTKLVLDSSHDEIIGINFKGLQTNKCMKFCGGTTFSVHGHNSCNNSSHNRGTYFKHTSFLVVRIIGVHEVQYGFHSLEWYCTKLHYGLNSKFLCIFFVFYL